MDTQPIANCCPKCQTALPPDAPQGLCPKCLFAAVATPTEADQPAGNRPAPPALTEIAAAFPQLEILEFIGQGGMGFVFKARQPKLDRLVALKILPQSLAADPTFAERFNREAKLLARLSHPGIVTVHDFGVATGRADLPVRQGDEAVRQHHPTSQFYYLLMEFVDGVNLRQAMQAGRFTPDQALAIVPKICEALQFAHNEGILHRDIKPENILLDAKGRVKIADFGIAKLMGNDGRADLLVSQAAQQHRPTDVNLTEAGKTLGSPNYMAPEQLEHPGEVDHRADIYSLGVVFYEMLTGELPLGRFAPPSQKSAADPRVDEVVLRALEKERERRQHSAGEVRAQVETITGTPPGSSGRESAQTEKSEIGNRKSEMSPRFSRTAIVGAAWLTLFSAVVPAFLWHEAKTHEFENHGPFASALTVFVFFVFIFPTFIAPFGATILGWVAVSQIRRSAGKLHGLWLAVFDGLLFPLLALDGLIYIAVGLGLWAAGLGWKRTSPPTLPLSVLLFVAVLIGILLLVDWLIIRAVWRVVNKPAGASVQPVQKPDRFWRWFAVAVFAMIAIPFLISIIGLLAAIAIPSFAKARAQSQENARRAAAQMATNQLAAQDLSLGPVVSASALQFHLVSPEDSTEPADSLPENSGRTHIRVLREILLDGSAVAQAGVDFSLEGRRRIEIRFTEAGKLRFEEVTRTNINHQLAIVFQGKVLSAPFIRSAISGGECQIDGDMSREEIYALLDSLNRTIGASDQMWKFTAPRERILPQQPMPEFLVGWLDLDSGTVMTNSKLDWESRAGHGWISSNSLDIATTDGSKEVPVLLSFDLTVLPAPTNGWEAATAIDVAQNWGLLQNEPQQMKMIGAVPGQSDTYFFRSREGGMGIFQITGFTENPRGVKIRYKLVQDSASTKPATSSIAARVAGGELEIIAVRKYPAAPSSSWWSPDGRPSEILPAVRAGEYPAAPSGSVGVELLVRQAFPDGVYPLETRFYPAQGMPQKDTFICHLSADPKAAAMDATFQIASGPWRDVGRQEGQMSVNENWGVDFMVDRFQSAAGGVEWRIVAVDAEGVEHPHNASITLTSGPDTGRTTFTFGGRFAKAADRALVVQSVTEFRLQRRDGHAVIFHNISLQPGHYTTVEAMGDSVKQTQKQKNTP